VAAVAEAAYEMASKVAEEGIAMLPADYWQTQHKLAFQLFVGMLLLQITHPTKQTNNTKTKTERAQCEYLCKNVETAQRLFDQVLDHVEDVWETIEIYAQRNQLSICLQRYDVRPFIHLHPLLFHTHTHTHTHKRNT
jgi:hypothetical protein